MKIALVLLTISVSYATARRPIPCDGLENIVSCVCSDEASSEVPDPRDWRKDPEIAARAVSCACTDASEWEAPEPPCGGIENVVGCEISCADGTVEPAPGGRFRRPGGRGRGRGRARGRGGRGGNGGRNGDGDEEGDDYDGEEENEVLGLGRFIDLDKQTFTFQNYLNLWNYL